MLLIWRELSKHVSPRDKPEVWLFSRMLASVWTVITCLKIFLEFLCIVFSCVIQANVMWHWCKSNWNYLCKFFVRLKRWTNYNVGMPFTFRLVCIYIDNGMSAYEKYLIICHRSAFLLVYSVYCVVWSGSIVLRLKKLLYFFFSLVLVN